MLRAATFALLAVLSAPLQSQQPVYPDFPPPPSPSGDNAPHSQKPQQAPTSGAQHQPDRESQGQPQDVCGDSPATPAWPDSAAPQKPSPYPPSDPEPAPQIAPAYPPQGDESQGAPPWEPSPSAAYPQSQNSLGWVPRGMELLARTAALHTDFTFDKSMLRLVSGVWDGPTDPATASALSRLDGISVHSYRYAAPGLYDPRLLETVRRQYGALGWQHLVSARPRTGGGATDLWISFRHLQVTGGVVLFENATNLNLIAFSGNLSPLDLLHLRGHFGIPRFEGDHFVPAPAHAVHVAPAAR